MGNLQYCTFLKMRICVFLTLALGAIFIGLLHKQNQIRYTNQSVNTRIEAGKRNTLSLLELTSQQNLVFRDIDQSDWSDCVTLAVLAELIATLLFSALNYWMGLN